MSILTIDRKEYEKAGIPFQVSLDRAQALTHAEPPRYDGFITMLFRVNKENKLERFDPPLKIHQVTNQDLNCDLSKHLGFSAPSNFTLLELFQAFQTAVTDNSTPKATKHKLYKESLLILEGLFRVELSKNPEDLLLITAIKTAQMARARLDRRAKSAPPIRHKTPWTPISVSGKNTPTSDNPCKRAKLKPRQFTDRINQENLLRPIAIVKA